MAPSDAGTDGPVVVDDGGGARADAARDAGAGPPADANHDARLDATMDGHADAVPDVSLDSAHDASHDAPTDTPADTSSDAAYDAIADQSVPVLLAPRPLAPLSTSRVTRRTPTFHWELPDGVEDVTIDLCLDRACTRPIGASAHVVGATYAPTEALPVGVVFWRLHPSTSKSVTSATWQLTVGAGDALVDTSWGTTLDVNGDGYADVVVGEPGGGTLAAGAAYTFLGSATGLSSTPASTLTDPRGGVSESFAYVVTGAGDVNGDGFSDVVITSHATFTGKGAPANEAYVYLGGPSGLALAPSTTLLPPATAGDAGSLGAYGFGASIAGAGDVNGDGYADVVVTNGLTAYVYLGGAAGLSAAPSTTLTGSEGSGASTSTAQGVVVTAGDLNGDGYGDIVLGSSYSSGGAVAYANVFFGGPSGLATAPSSRGAIPATLPGSATQYAVSVWGMSSGDFNGDGYADLLLYASVGTNSGVSGSAWYVFPGSATGIAASPATTLSTSPVEYDNFGATAGDLNGDGFADIVVSVDGTTGATGRFVYLGSPNGISTAPSSVLVKPTGLTFGAIAGAGQVMGDGFSGLLIAGYSTLTQLPTVYVYSGGATGLSATPAVALSNGVVGSSFGWSMFGATN